MKRIFSLFIALALILTLAPTAMAAGEIFGSFVETTRSESTVAPGLTQENVTVKDTSNSKQTAYYKLTVDLKNHSDLHMYANYKDGVCDGKTWGLQTLSAQMKGAQKVHSDPSSEVYVPNFQVVAGVDADFFNMATGEPSGLLVMNGKLLHNPTNQPFFAIKNDGTPMIGFNSQEYYNNKDNIKEAVGAQGGPLVQNGQSVVKAGTNDKVYPRCIIGLDKDNNVIIIVVDALQAPYSYGVTPAQLAELAIAEGCVTAARFDEGGSAEMVARKEGTNDLVIVNKPSDTYERVISSTLIIATTTPPSDDFNRAAMTVDHEYITPGGTVNITAAGVSSAGTSADIPADAEWVLTNPNAGTLTANDNGGYTFKANDTESEAEVQIKQDDVVKGSVTIHVVKPDEFSFTQSSYAVPYGKTVPFSVNATYQHHDVALHDGDVTITLDPPSLGQMDGYIFSACQEGLDAPTTGKATATLKCNGKTAEASLTLGKGSEIFYGFDDPSCLEELNTNPGTQSGFGWGTGIKIEHVTAENGLVHDGTGALKVTMDWANLQDDLYGGGWDDEQISFNKAQAIKGSPVNVGVWVWIPEEEVYSGFQFFISGGQSEEYLKQGYKYDEGYWHYIDLSVSPENKNITMSILLSINLACRTENTEIDQLMPPSTSKTKLVFYVDSICVDYSSARPDRVAPTFGHVRTSSGGTSSIVPWGQQFAFEEGVDTVSFSVDVSDPEDINSTGVAGGEAYIDGVEIGSSLANGVLSTSSVKLAAGVHTLKFVVRDGAEGGGNESTTVRWFEIKANTEAPTVQIVKSDKNVVKDRIPITSIYWFDVQATDVSKIQSVTMDLDLNNISVWQLDHAEVDPKFEMTWEYLEGPYDGYGEQENIVTVTLTRTKPYEEGDEDILASLPVRTWGEHFEEHSELCAQQKSRHPSEAKWTMKLAWDNKCFYPCDISIEIDRGEIVYVDGYNNETARTFSGATLRVLTELYTYAQTVTRENPDKKGWHVHDAELTQLSKEATCTEKGYEGRTYCNTCHSVVDWGTDIPVKDHNFVTGEDGLLRCTVGQELFNGVYEGDGKTYVEGKAIAGWQADGSYFVDGMAVKGLQLIGDTLYDFGTDGVCKNQTPYTGFYTKTGESGTVTYSVVAEQPKAESAGDTPTYYALGGETQTGWFSVLEEHYHAGGDGKLHNVTTKFSGSCTVNGYNNYTCECTETDQSELLWAPGHTWDENHHCTVCGKDGIDIANAHLSINGMYFTYTGSGIRAAHTVTYNGRTLVVYSDRRGIDGYAEFSDNVDIGIATLTISGRGDFYGELVGHFMIVPASVETISGVQTTDGSVKLNWNACKGAEYYEVYRLVDETNDQWEAVSDHLTGTEFTLDGLKIGENYTLRVASRAERDGETYYCSFWSDTITGTVNHLWGVPEEGSHDVTCTEDGLLIHTCTDCQKHEEVTTPALGHTVTDWETVKEPTYTEEGQRIGHCSRCTEEVTEAIPKLQYVSPGSGGSTAPDVKQETVTNPDGSKTTTTTKPDGSKTETTTQTDGTVTEKNTDKSGVVTETTKAPDNTVTEKVTQTDGSATERTTTPEGVVGQTSTNAEGEITAAEVVIPKEVEKQDVVTAPVEVPAAKSADEAPEISVKTGSGQGVTVEIPVTEFGPGTVAVVVHPDGTEEVVRDCVIGENGVVLNVEGDVTLKIVDKTTSFQDVEPVDHWASGAVEFVAARELFNGTGENTFTPDGDMTRGMLVTVLYRLAYEPAAGGDDFADVPESAYYTDAVAWAGRNGIVTGYSDTEFGPNDEVTREQLVTILYRYADKNGLLSGKSGSLEGYADASSVSDYARDAMAWAIQCGIVRGKDATHLAPSANATRAEVATILMRFCAEVVG